MLIFNVYGRFIGVKRDSGRWLLFRVEINERKFSRNYDLAIPDELTENELIGWLGDMYHEAATERNPKVTRVE